MQLELLLRTILPFLASFIAAIIFGPAVIATLKRRKVGQTISEDGPESHKSKAGTPTMGGLIILAGIFAGVLFSVAANPSSYQSFSRSMQPLGYDLLAVLFLMLGFAILGMVDDYLTIHPIANVRGISSKPKAAIQLILAAGFILWLMLGSADYYSPVLMVGGKIILSGAWYWIFALVYIVGMANFVNITDGLDGLVSGLTAILCVGVVFI